MEWCNEKPECHLSCTPITHSNLVCIYHADSEHDIVKSRVLLNWGNINFDFVWQWNWKKITVETNHQVREATHHFKVIVFQGYSNMSKITDGSHVYFVALIKLTRSHLLKNEHLHHIHKIWI
ncbi:unnamed protein product [Musa acuminata subsp. burmannicoides]